MVPSMGRWSIPPKCVVEWFAEQAKRPLKKPNGKARTIALVGALLKLASGAIPDEIRAQPGEDGAAWNQYGASRGTRNDANGRTGARERAPPLGFHQD
jgi:hypothetical protein